LFRDGDLLLVDAGAEYQCYATDITRTWPINGKFTKAQLDVYNVVLDIQKKFVFHIFSFLFFFAFFIKQNKTLFIAVNNRTDVSQLSKKVKPFKTFIDLLAS
jgi:hypothetical protein